MHYGTVFQSLDQYEEALQHEITRRRNSIVALKCGSAYDRSLSFGKVSRKMAESGFGKHPSTITDAERTVFGDYMLHKTLEIAGDLDLPYQFHLGLAKLSGSNPMLLEPLIASYPNVKFVLFHGGFPWYLELAGLAHNYNNVILDLCWLPLFSTKTAESALHEFLDVARSSEIITWGGDNWISEESFGAYLALRHVLAKVLAERVGDGYWNLKDAEGLMGKVMYKTAKQIYIK